MRETFKSVNFSTDSISKLNLCQEIIEKYMAMNLRLTLRQLYYQLVTCNAIPNKEREYKNLGRLVSDARLAGLIDWDAIEDRIRQPRIQGEFENLADLIETALYAYRLPRWSGQECHVELWVEKDALAGVLFPLASKYHITLMVNRGYSSQSAMYESANRFKAQEEKHSIILYLGDHDPSGEDMVRDIQDRLDLFDANVAVIKIALTMDQIEQYNPPPNPAKITDPRAEAYVRQYGEDSWEVDALPPDELARIVSRSIEARVDQDKMAEIIKREEKDKKILRRFVRREKR